MIRFYEGSGSSEIDLLDRSMPPPEWSRLKAAAVKLLRARNQDGAAEFLEKHAFEPHHGTNGFGDDFELLYMKVPMQQYVELAELAVEHSTRLFSSLVVRAFSEVGKGLRFIAAELDTADGPQAVASPSLTITSDIVECALADAHRRIADQGATSGVDRIHTVFHGYLRELLARSRVAFPPAAGITELFRLVRDLPAMRKAAPQQAEVDKILRGLANVIDALNPLRNHASVAHANSTLLPEAEAMLVINSVRSLLHYLDAKMR